MVRHLAVSWFLIISKFCCLFFLRVFYSSEIMNDVQYSKLHNNTQILEWSNLGSKRIYVKLLPGECCCYRNSARPEPKRSADSCLITTGWIAKGNIQVNEIRLQEADYPWSGLQINCVVEVLDPLLEERPFWGSRWGTARAVKMWRLHPKYECACLISKLGDK